MLPFLQPRKMSSVMMAVTKPEGGVENKGPEEEEDHALMSASEDLISAIHAKDATAVAKAWRSGSEILDQDDEGDEENASDSSV